METSVVRPSRWEILLHTSMAFIQRSVMLAGKRLALPSTMEWVLESSETWETSQLGQVNVYLQLISLTRTKSNWKSGVFWSIGCIHGPSKTFVPLNTVGNTFPNADLITTCGNMFSKFSQKAHLNYIFFK